MSTFVRHFLIFILLSIRFFRKPGLKCVREKGEIEGEKAKEEKRKEEGE